MNLLEIIMEYLSKDTPRCRELYLKHMVDDCGMDPALVRHIKGVSGARQAYVGLYRSADGTKDVNIYTLELAN